MNIYPNEVLELEVNEVLYNDYDNTKNILIKSNINTFNGYTLYISQEKADEVIEVTSTRTVGQYLVFDSSTLSLDSAFNLKVKKNSNDVILSKTFEYTIISDTSTLSIPTYSNITPNPGDCYITYNEDDTFNVYIPMNFTSNSSDVFYSIKLHDVEANTDYYIEGNDYIASKCNLNNSKYSIIYQIYYRYNGVSYYITGEWPSGTITGTLDTSSTTLSIDSETSQFTINSFYYNYLEEVTVKYTDGSSEVVTVDLTYSTGNYDNTKEIASIVVNACEKVITTEFEETLSSNNIVLVGNKYKEIEITNS